MSKDNPVVIIVGPTASGKSALALALADEFAGTIINADSMQVYRELDILTARPGADDEARAPHRLFGVMAAAAACSVGRWLGLAGAEIEAVWNDGRLPIVTGGTGMYLKALTQGLAAVPEIPDDINAEVRALYGELGGDAFREALAKLDADAAHRLPAGDSQRLTRAMAVVKATGMTLAQWQSRQNQGPAIEARFMTIALVPGREALYAATDARFEKMLADGALEEALALLALGLDSKLPAMKALGVPELARHLAGETGLEDATAEAKQATRNFVKRQLTWLGNQGSADYVIEDFYGPAHRSDAAAAVRAFLAGA